MRENIQINVKFKKKNTDHMTALNLIRSRSQELGYSYGTYITMAVLAYEQMDPNSELADMIKKGVAEVLEEYVITKPNKVIPKM